MVQVKVACAGASKMDTLYCNECNISVKESGCLSGAEGHALTMCIYTPRTITHFSSQGLAF